MSISNKDLVTSIILPNQEQYSPIKQSQIESNGKAQSILGGNYFNNQTIVQLSSHYSPNLEDLIKSNGINQKIPSKLAETLYIMNDSKMMISTIKEEDNEDDYMSNKLYHSIIIERGGEEKESSVKQTQYLNSDMKSVGKEYNNQQYNSFFNPKNNMNNQDEHVIKNKTIKNPFDSIDYDSKLYTSFHQKNIGDSNKKDQRVNKPSMIGKSIIYEVPEKPNVVYITPDDNSNTNTNCNSSTITHTNVQSPIIIQKNDLYLIPGIRDLNNIDLAIIPKCLHMFKLNDNDTPLKESSELKEQRRMIIINDNKHSIVPLCNNNIYSYQEIITNEVIMSKLRSAFDISNISKAAYDERIQALSNENALNDNDIYSIYKAIPFKSFQSLFNNPKIKGYGEALECLGKDIQFTRSVLCNGEGFYRAIAFAMIEHYLLTKSQNKLELLSYLIAIDNNINGLSLTLLASEKQAMLLLLLILIEHSKISPIDTYPMFINAFLTDLAIETALIKYIKITLAKYIITNISKFPIDILSKQIPSEYLSNNQFNVQSYINKEIFSSQREPDNFILTIIPKVLRINMIFYYVEPKALIKRKFIGEYNEDDTAKFPFIHIIGTFARYHIGYTDEFQFTEYNNYHVLDNGISLSNIINKSDKAFICSKCKGVNDNVSFTQCTNISLCKTCLINALHQTATSLVDMITKDSYDHIECKHYFILRLDYCQPIQISTHPNIAIGDNEMIDLLQMTIPQYIYSLLVRYCVICDKMFFGFLDQFIEISCRCNYCPECIKDKVKADTNSLILLNFYELSIIIFLYIT